jgi:hypothetical protein
MKVENRCPVCYEENLVSRPAKIAPFIIDRMFHNTGPTECLFHHCINCDFRWFNIRPDASEMSNLYNDYRGKNYQQQRMKYEPSYTESMNQMIGNSDKEVEVRGELLNLVLKNNSVPRNISVLDFGGNDGRFIPKHVTGKKYCYDISGNSTVPGVSMLSSQDLIGRTFDLILLAHVLEHVSYPRDVMKEVTPLMSSSSYLYIELPDEVSIPIRRHLTRYIKSLIREIIPRPLRPGLMHEHINQFTVRSLKILLLEMGLECIDIGTKRVDFGGEKVNLLFSLSRKL